MLAIFSLLIVQWYLSLFCQSFFLHRYSAHRMFAMSQISERFFYLLTLLSQGVCFLNPRAYSILHQQHHMHSDKKKDPHSPHHSKGPMGMMVKTLENYTRILKSSQKSLPYGVKPIYPTWPALDKFSGSNLFHFSWGLSIFLFYCVFAPHWSAFLLAPLHFILGPIQGAIVNYFGHKLGYQNFDNKDHSRNTLPVDFLLLGELYQNNHHKFPKKANFAHRWFELDITWPIIKLLSIFRIIKMA